MSQRLGKFIGQNIGLISYVTSIALATSILIHFYCKNKFQFFKRRGLKNPPPWPLLGNMATVLLSDRMSLERKWTQLYGKVYGVFHGLKPCYVIGDPEVIRQICVRDFDSFPNHEFDSLMNDYTKNFLFFLQDDRWKRIRALQSPTFTSGKMRRMYRLLERCADDLVQCFSEQLDRKDSQAGKCIVNLKDIYSLYTMDAITSAAYGLKLAREGSSKLKSARSRNRFVKLALKQFEINMPRLVCALVVPKWILEPLGFKVSTRHHLDELAVNVRQMLDQRRESGKKHDDYLQILVEAKLDDKIELDQADEKENHHALLSQESLERDRTKMLEDLDGNGMAPAKQADDQHVTTGRSNSMTEDEIISSALFLLLVGVETTGSLLTNCTYALSFHQDVQEKLYQTIRSIAQVDPNTGECTFDYDTLTSCEYLDAVVSETLRALAPVFQLDRLASRDYRIAKYNLDIKKGDKLLLNYYGVMNDRDYWPEPTKFDPERFMPGRKEKIVPYSYVPFGVGPRHCLGMRFSLTETKLALARVLMKFKFLLKPGMTYPPESKRSLGLNLVKTPLAELVLREQCS